MWKHVTASSIQSAYVGAMVLVLISLPAFGGAAMIFGVIALPVAVFWCLVLAYPLFKLRQAVQLQEHAWFAIFSAVGFLFGAITPVLMFGLAGTGFSSQSAPFLGLYGLLGMACAITAWNYVRRHVTL